MVSTAVENSKSAALTSQLELYTKIEKLRDSARELRQATSMMTLFDLLVGIVLPVTLGTVASALLASRFEAPSGLSSYLGFVGAILGYLLLMPLTSHLLKKNDARLLRKADEKELKADPMIAELVKSLSERYGATFKSGDEEDIVDGRTVTFKQGLGFKSVSASLKAENGELFFDSIYYGERIGEAKSFP